MHEWLLWGESLQKNGFTGTTSKAGYPDSYQYTGDICYLRNLPAPFFLGGFTVGVTKSAGGRFKGNLSYGAQYCYVPSIQDTAKFEACMNFPPKIYEREEQLTGETDSINVNEVTLMALLFGYGQVHQYPRNFLECAKMIREPIKKIHTPQFSVTSAGAITSGSGAAALSSASQEDLWIKKDSKYYIIGAIPHLVNNAGLLQFQKNLPMSDYHSNVLPLLRGSNPVTFGVDGPTTPYEPIGPFSMSSEPSVGLFSLAAAATTFSLIIAEV